MNTPRKIVLGFGAVLLMLAVIAVIACRSTRGLIATVQRVAHARQELEAQESLLQHLLEADSAARGFVLAADERYLPEHHEAQESALEDYSALRALSSASPVQQQRLDRIKPLLTQKFAILNSAITARREAGIEAASAILSNGEDRRVTAELRHALHDFRTEEQRNLVRSSDFTERLGRSATITIALATALTTLILGIAAVVILRDDAARRRAEEALAEEHNLLSSIMDALPEHVFVKDTEGCYVIDNVAHRRFLGVQSPGEVEGKTVLDFFPREVARHFIADDRRVIETGVAMLNHEEPVSDYDGGLLWLSTTKLPLRDTEGNCTGLLCVSSDISIRKKADDKLRLTAEQLKRSNQELQEFASVASHDLQEPLRKIQAFGDRLQTKCGDQLGDAGRDYLDRILDAARRMQILVQDLLTLSRITSKAQPFAATDLREIVEGVISDLEVRIEQTGAQVEIGHLPTVDADPLQMRQLFQNLIANALKFQRPGTRPGVIISGRRLEAAEELLPGASPGDEICQIRVMDNGIGFDAKYAERIFHVFQRLHSRSEYEGTGIGLALCRKILDRHGGIIAAKSAAGEGATFIVTMPVKQRMKLENEEAPR